MFKTTRNVYKKIKRNRVRILTYTTLALTGAVVVQRSALKEHDDFLVAKGLIDEYYYVED